MFFLPSHSHHASIMMSSGFPLDHLPFFENDSLTIWRTTCVSPTLPQKFKIKISPWSPLEDLPPPNHENCLTHVHSSLPPCKYQDITWVPTLGLPISLPLPQSASIKISHGCPLEDLPPPNYENYLIHVHSSLPPCKYHDITWVTQAGTGSSLEDLPLFEHYLTHVHYSLPPCKISPPRTSHKSLR